MARRAHPPGTAGNIGYIGVYGHSVAKLDSVSIRGIQHSQLNFRNVDILFILYIFDKHVVERLFNFNSCSFLTSFESCSVYISATFITHISAVHIFFFTIIHGLRYLFK